MFSSTCVCLFLRLFVMSDALYMSLHKVYLMFIIQLLRSIHNVSLCIYFYFKSLDIAWHFQNSLNLLFSSLKIIEVHLNTKFLSSTSNCLCFKINCEAVARIQVLILGILDVSILVSTHSRRWSSIECNALNLLSFTLRYLCFKISSHTINRMVVNIRYT